MNSVGVATELALSDPAFSALVWKSTPAGVATRLSQGRWYAPPHLKLLSRKLIDVATGRCRRLIVTMPPRHGKSEMVSHWNNVWFLENFQHKRIILCSYESEFAAKWGGKVRDTIAANQDHLTIRFKTKNPSMHNWETSKGGAMMCAGVGGPITGKGADLFVIDDFVKNAEEANSRTIRDKVWDWWTSTARTRLEPGAGVIVMATRWHSDDLIGRLINMQFTHEKGTRENWEVFNFPAVADPESDKHYLQFGVPVNNVKQELIHSKATIARRQVESSGEWTDILGRKLGDPLWPERYDKEDLALLRGASHRDWYALFQQMPGDEVADGNVYHNFDEQKTCRELSHDPRMQLFISMDFNVNPMCAVIGQYDKNASAAGLDIVQVLEEVILANTHTGFMTNELIARLRKYRRGHELRVEIYGDAAGQQRDASSPKTNWQIVAAHMALAPDLHVNFIRKKANPTIGDRVNAVNTMLAAADGTRRLFVDDIKCPELVQDLKKVKWLEDSSGNAKSQLDKSDPKRTHISDALGYMIEYRFGLRGKIGGYKGILM